MKIREAKTEDMQKILDIYTAAKAFMRAHDNPNQWGSPSYPGEDLLTNDIKKHQLFVVTDDADEDIFGVFAHIIGDDSTYAVIEGQWINNEPYGTIHRIASSGKVKGVANFCFDWAVNRCPNLRIDTHADNYVMQSVCESYGFKMCGIIHLENGDPRIAYHYVKK